MDARLLKRLFRAMGEGGAALGTVAAEIVESERRRGHTRLAADLEVIGRNVSKAQAAPRTAEGGAVRELRPLSKRQELLANLTPPDQLPHSMVLAPNVEERFARIEQEFAARERLALNGLEPRRRVLLYGPPGCGKTLGAQRLAWTTGLPLLKVRFDSLVSSLFGETASNLRRVFEYVGGRPSVLLLDECDYIARSRTARFDIGEASRIVNTLLQMLEEFNGPGLVVATTNIDKALDEALFRRFDDAFMLPLPKEAEVQELLKLSLSAMTVEGGPVLARVTKSLVGESAAAVVKVARDAAKLAVLEESPRIQQRHFDAALRAHGTSSP